MIVAKYSPDTVTFGKLSNGACFFSPQDDCLYIKTDESHRAVRLDNGTISEFDSYEVVLELPDAHVELD